MELVLALVLVTVVLHGAWTVFLAQQTAGARLGRRAEVLGADRVVRVVLGAEIAAGRAKRDWSVREPGLLELRAFRGWGLPCPGTATADTLRVSFRGLRLPDPTKDSVLVLERSGVWSVRALVRRTRADEGCAGVDGRTLSGSVMELWSLDAPTPDAVLVRLFERGSYHLRDGLLRYRRGEGGRQPLTPAVLDPDRTTLHHAPGDTAVVLSVYGPGGSGGGWTRVLVGNGGWPP